MKAAAPKPPVPGPLENLPRWLASPSTLGGLSAAALAAGYGAISLELPPGSAGYFLALVGAVAVLANLLGGRQEQASLLRLRLLAKGALSPSEENLKKGVAEAAAFPDRAFVVNLTAWLLSVLVLGLLFRLAPGAGWSHSLRILLLGFLLAPVSAVLSYLFVLQRSRRAVERVAQLGLSASEVARVLPARKQLRPRLLAFTAVVVLTPSLLVADLAVRGTGRTLQRVLEQTGAEAQRAVFETEQAKALLPALALVALVLLLVIAAGHLAGRALAAPMRSIAEEAARVGAGDLGSSRPVVAEDEVWAAGAAVVAVNEQLAQALGQLKRATLQLSSASGQLTTASTRQESTSAEMASTLAETSATTEELARSARSIAQNAQKVARLSDQTLEAALSGKKSSEAYFEAMTRMKTGNQAIADSIVKLNKRMQQIGNIVEFINGIADKADLLAVNAELEGTKAGEVGRGFSLVAAEMRRLAESVMEWTQEISERIEEIRDATNTAVLATEAGMNATERGSILSRQASSGLSQIVSLAQQAAQAVRSISAATHQQQAGSDQLAEVMAEVFRSTQAGAQASRQAAGANRDLLALAGELGAVLDRFKVS